MGGRGGSVQGRGLSETFSMRMGVYSITDGTVTGSSGRSVTVRADSTLRQPNEKEMAVARKAGIEDPVVVGYSMLPRKVAVAAVEQSRKIAQNMAENLRRNVPGLQQLEDARNYDRAQANAFYRSLENEYRSSKPSGTPRSNAAAALEKKYPAAVAYLTAESYAYASNDRKAALGQEAMRKIRSGASYKKTIAAMKKAWSDYALEATKYN